MSEGMRMTRLESKLLDAYYARREAEMNESGPVVYVVQDDGQKNVLPALKYGSIEALITGRDHQLYNTAPLIEELQRKLAGFRECDYLLLIGDPAAIAICAAIASDLTGGKLQLLKWDRQERTYYPLLVDISKRGE